MKTTVSSPLMLLVLLAFAAPVQVGRADEAEVAALRAGRHFIPAEVYSLEVAAYAHRIIDADKAGRRSLYRELGLPEDPSVK